MGGSLKSCELFAHRHLYNAGSAKEGIKGTSIALQNPLPGGMRGAELGSGIFRLCDITLTNLAQIVSNDLFRKHCTLKVCDFLKVPAVLYRWNCGWVYTCDKER